MRKELELIEKIEQYLDGNLSRDEKEAFEGQMNADPSLRGEVLLQKQVQKGIERTALKMSMQKVALRFRVWRSFYRWGLGLSIIVIAGLAVYYAMNGFQHTSLNENDGLPVYNEAGDKV